MLNLRKRKRQLLNILETTSWVETEENLVNKPKT